MKWENIFSCEIDDFCNKVTKHHFPECIQHGDITTTGFRIYRGRIDVLTGGFPCQTFSMAGKGAMDLSLWKQMLRAIQEIQPCWIIPENVRGIVSRKRGVAFDQVQADMEANGYEVLPLLLPACGVEAPHQRYRIFIVAHLAEQGNGGLPVQQWGEREKDFDADGLAKNTYHTNAEIGGLPEWDGQQDGAQGRQQNVNGRIGRPHWENFPTRSPVWHGVHGLPGRLDTETISGSEWRRKSIEAGGNAIVPQVAYEIFKTIDQYEKLNLK